MGLFKKTEKRSVETAQTDSTSAAELLVSMMSGESMTVQKALSIPAVARSIDMIANAVAELPVKLYRKTSDNGVEEIKSDSRIAILSNRTGDSMNASEMRKKWVRDYLLQGGAYGYLERDFSGKITRIFYLPPSEVGILAARDDPIHKDYRISVRGRSYYPYQFLKILRYSDGYGKGRGIIKENALPLSVMYSTLKFEESLVKKGGNKKGFLKTSAHVSDTAIEKIKASWRKLYSNEGEGCLFLNDGIDFKEASASSTEMQLNENKQTNMRDLLSLFGTTDGMLSDATIKNAVMPVLDAFEAAFDADLLTEAEKGEYYFSFDTRELTRGDMGARYSAYAVALDKGFMQIDEVRKLEDLPALGVDFIKLNLADSFYDPKTRRIYTPNTNQWTDMEAGSSAPDDNVQQGERENFQNRLTGGNNDDIIDVRSNPNRDPNNGRFTYGNADMSPAEITRVSSQFATDFPNAKKGKVYHYENRNYFYLVRVRGFGDYCFELKMEICEENREVINDAIRSVKNGKYK